MRQWLTFSFFLQYNNNAPSPQERQVETWSDKTMLHATPQTSLGADYPVSVKRDLYLDRESQIESHLGSSRLSLYSQDYGLGSRSSTIGRPGGPVVTQVCVVLSFTCYLQICILFDEIYAIYCLYADCTDYANTSCLCRGYYRGSRS